MKTLRYANIVSIALMLLYAAVFGACAQSAQTTYVIQTAETVAADKRTAIILMIEDGGGFNQYKASSFYRYGSYPSNLWKRFPVRLAVTTYPEGGSYDPAAAWTDSVWPTLNPTDSAAAATALATGTKTANGMIGMASDGTVLESVIERAETVGMMTGIVTTVPISHATPAAFASHFASRGSYAAIANAMIFDSGLDILMGCGNPDYDNDGTAAATPNYGYIPKAAWDSLEAGTAANDRDQDGTPEPWTLLTKADECAALRTSAKFVHALFVPSVHDTLQQARSGNAAADAYEVPFTAGVPTLSDMTLSALAMLSKGYGGFILVVEGGAVDWANHANQSGRMIEEAGDFDRAVEAVLRWIDENPAWANALLIVTADHESGYLLGEGSGGGVFADIENRGAGVLPGMQWYGTGHTNTLVPLFAKGTGSDGFLLSTAGTDPVRGTYIDNTTVGKLIFETLGN